MAHRKSSGRRHQPHIPVLNIPKEDLSIRPELLALLPYANIDSSHLITLDDLNLAPPKGRASPLKQTADEVGDVPRTPKSGLSPTHASLILVDHNALDGPLGQHNIADQPSFCSSIVGCVDHHQEEHQVPPDTGDEPRIIQKCGSCTSLVIDHLRSSWEELSGSSSASTVADGQGDVMVGADDEATRRTWDAQIAKLAVASVLVDTRCLGDPSKVEDVDRRAVDYLEAKIALAPGKSRNYERQAFWEEIMHTKTDLGKLGVEECLRKDFKTWKVKVQQQADKDSEDREFELGVSSVVKPIAWLADKARKETGKQHSMEGLEKQLESFTAERGLSVHAIMTASTSEHGQFQREICLSAAESHHENILDTFEKDLKDSLGLEPWSEVPGDDRKSTMQIWWQRDVSKSRKEVAPLLRNVVCKALSANM